MAKPIVSRDCASPPPTADIPTGSGRHFTEAESGLPIAGLGAPLPCPFCGSTDIEIELQLRREPISTKVVCGQCGLEGGYTGLDGDEESAAANLRMARKAAAFWNTRAPAALSPVPVSLTPSVFDAIDEQMNRVNELAGLLNCLSRLGPDDVPEPDLGMAHYTAVQLARSIADALTQSAIEQRARQIESAKAHAS